MRTLIITLTLLICTLHSYAQTDTLYFDQDWKQTDLAAAINYRVYRLDSTNTNTERYFLTEDYSITRDRLISTGGYLLKKEQVKHGFFTFYDTTGNIRMTGNYNHGNRTGIWKMYRPQSKDIWTETQFYNDSSTELTTYYPDGKVKRKQTDSLGQPAGKCFDEQGREIPFTPFEIFPKPTFDMSNFLRAHMRYPNNARRNNIEGRVIVQFVVDIDGQVKEIAIFRSVNPDLDAEATRVVSKMPPWTPGIQDDKILKVHYSLPISFQLN